MKFPHHVLASSIATVLAAGFLVPSAFSQATISKDALGTNLADAASWTGGVAPTSLDTAQFATTSLVGALTVDAPVNWSRLIFQNTITGPVSISGSAITLSGATSNGSLDVLTTASTHGISITSDLILAGVNSTAAVSVGNTTARLQLASSASANSLTFGNVTSNGGALANDANLFLRGTGSSTINGTLTVDGQLGKGDAGTWTLNGANTLGWVFINNGTLLAGNDAAFGGGTVYVGSGGGNVTLASANSSARSYSNALDFTGGTGFTSIANFGQTSGGTGVQSFSGGVNLGTVNRNIATNSNTTFSGNVTGAGGAITKTGSSMLTLSGTNTYTGGTIVNGGYLNFTSAASLPATGAITIGSGGALIATAAQASVQDWLLKVNATSSGVIALTGDSAENINFATGGHNALHLGTNGTATYSGTITPGSGGYRFAGFTGSNLTVSSVLSGASALTKAGNGTVTLTGANTFTGALAVTGGTLKAGVATIPGTSGAFGLDVAVTLTNGAGVSLDLNGFNTRVGTLSGGGTTGGNLALGTATLTVGSGTTNIGNGTAALTFAGAITGSGTLTYAGNHDAIASVTNQVVLSGTNTGFTGQINVSGARLNTTAPAHLGSATVNIGQFGQFLSATAVTYANNFIVSGTGGWQESAALNFGAIRIEAGSTISGGVTLNVDTTLGSNNTTTGGNFSGVISEDATPRKVTKSGSGILIFSGANTYSGGTTISAGTLQIGNGGTVGNLGLGDVLNSGALTFNRSDAFTVSNAISGSGSVTNTGTGTLTLSGANTFSGQASFNAGVLAVGSSSALGTGPLRFGGGTLVSSDATDRTITNPLDVAASSTLGSVGTGKLTFSGTQKVGGTVFGGAAKILTVNGTVEFSGVLTDGGGTNLVTKAGAGTLIFSGNNTYTRPTSVDAGTLLINGTISGATTINGGTLGGSGTTGALTLATGTLAPGNSPGILSTTSNVALNGGTFALELNGGTAGTGYDQLAVAGTVNFGATVALTIALGFTPSEGQAFTIVSNDLLESVGFDLATSKGFAFESNFLDEGEHFLVGAQEFAISYAGGTDNNDIVLTAVPEPGSCISLLAGFGMLLGMRRRRQS